ncbi:hypothetical protein M427DRAFT_268465 [Gonapodya prolifera JEL478]|uniref:Alpha/beta hydrolase fold-3 domain-containing protein n=1 Tax=Gonapodya prolifera (strain JEL478) TaxID=1344416 RepID=A0A139AKM0_GONPJ|nr:hypothetical protein M427DRAFT_268465 [Gonapodya prolifera JEL478]|eukprot:KXS16975.1 hypothetical protein M427DRAFT_268465 [Gonapodya prolifera JEL478]
MASRTRPRTSRSPPPLHARRRVLFEAHGGGWVLGALEMGSSLKRELCRRADCVVVSVDYVLPPEYPFPYAQEQLFGVLKWLAEESDEGGVRRLGIDPGELYFLGFSAGANLLSER